MLADVAASVTTAGRIRNIVSTAMTKPLLEP
jgi:hypothetical protein